MMNIYTKTTIQNGTIYEIYVQNMKNKKYTKPNYFINVIMPTWKSSLETYFV